MQVAMHYYTARPVAHGSAHEPVTIQPLTLERHKYGSSFYLARVRHYFTEAITLAGAEEPSSGRQ
jgi:hypothetical protein